MGEIADMMIEGVLDEETGEYIGDINEGIYGYAAPGFPISYERNGFDSDAPGVTPPKPKAEYTRCPDCNKRVKAVGLRDHQRDAHNIT